MSIAPPGTRLCDVCAQALALHTCPICSGDVCAGDFQSTIGLSLAFVRNNANPEYHHYIPMRICTTCFTWIGAALHTAPVPEASLAARSRRAITAGNQQLIAELQAAAARRRLQG